MRVIRELPYRECKITIFSWNNRYLIKMEQGLLEQTFKVDQFDVLNEDELIRLIDEPFIQLAHARFQDMAKSLNSAKERLNV